VPTSNAQSIGRWFTKKGQGQHSEVKVYQHFRHSSLTEDRVATCGLNEVSLSPLFSLLSLSFSECLYLSLRLSLYVSVSVCLCMFVSLFLPIFSPTPSLAVISVLLFVVSQSPSFVLSQSVCLDLCSLVFTKSVYLPICVCLFAIGCLCVVLSLSNSVV